MIHKLKTAVKCSVVVLALGAVAQATGSTEALARVGGGRSMGRTSSSYRAAPPAMARPQPAPSPYGNNTYNRVPTPPLQEQANAGRGGFFRGMAGGIAGGFLGSMVFNSLGHAFGGGGGYGGGGYGGGGGGGGIGLFDLLLLGGAAYLAYRWWTNRQRTAATTAIMGNDGLMGIPPHGYGAPVAVPAMGLSGEDASDLFFKIQGAWTRRDLSSVKDLLGADIAKQLDGDLEALRSAHKINRLENIAIRRVDMSAPWDEDGAVLTTAHFTANLLDYTVDDHTNAVVDGDDRVPVKFEEIWTFSRAQGSDRWQLAGIEQV